ncbi:hypothetical protein HK103_005518 [Boothiomyces macroporosus]|uniref:CCAAT-binding factor domain-containing protein n=1 Tax=Boothiomyces macroporosus TaxID=261099 RepID=A0AAD5UI01_9FUNG|nr:hypothetical protein HK103_005518 [Boothiomyces macroporosus]
MVKKNKPSNSRAVLLQEIKALGGDHTDLDLLNDVLSGSEAEDEEDQVKVKPEAKVDEKSLKNDLMKLFKTMDFDSARPKDSDEDEPVKTKEQLKKEKRQLLKEAKKLAKEEQLKRTVELAAFTDEFLQDNPDEFTGSSATYGKKEESNVRDMVSQMLKGTKPVDKLEQDIIFKSSVWYENELPEIKYNGKPSPDNVAKELAKAKALWLEDCKKFEMMREQNSKANKDFVATILKSGTVTDKVSALTLLIQESPVHTFNHLNDNLIHGMAKKKARREALLAIDSIKDLLLNNLLPNRKLNYFVDQPCLSHEATPAHLIAWCYEDALKKAYFEFLQIVEELSKDVLQHVKSKMLSTVFELLCEKPEQEENLLTLLVNKMGDLDKKIASKATYLLTQLLIKHPAMKSVVIKEVERLLFRPNVADRAKYYAITFLNQIILTKSKSDVEAANHLVHLYFTIFESIVKAMKEEKEEQVQAKKPEDKKKKGKKRPSKYNRGPKKKGPDNTPALVKIDGVNSKMMAALLTGVNRAFPFASLETKVIQALTLIFQVQSSREVLSDRFYTALYDTLLDRRLLDASRQAAYLNLLYRALKADLTIDRVRSFVKRLVQCISFAQVPLICGSLFLLSELCNQRPGLWPMVTQPEDNEEERFVDVDTKEDEQAEAKTFENEKSDSEEETKSESETSQEDKESENGEKAEMNLTGPRKYDGKKRNPLYANASVACLWELVPFANHYHPTVALYAKTLLSGNPIKVPEGAVNYDPLLNHTLSRFLERFVYKAPKKVKTVHHGSSIMQPRTTQQNDMLLVGGRKKANAIFEDEELGEAMPLDDAPVNQANWLSKSESEVPVDEVFFYKYFKDRKTNKPVQNEQDDISLADSDQEDMDEAEIWDAMTKSAGFDKAGLNIDDDDIAFEDEELDYNDQEDSDEDEPIDPENMEEMFKKMDGLGSEGSEDEDEGDMAAWAKEDDEWEDEGEDEDLDEGEDEDLDEGEDEDLDEDADFAKDLAAQGGSDEEDNLFTSMLDDGLSDEERDAKKKKKDTLSSKAKKLGYKGDFFDNSNGKADFASAEDFEDMLKDLQSESEGEELPKKKRKKFSAGPKGKKLKRK